MNGQSCDGQLIGEHVNFLTKPGDASWSGDVSSWYDRCTGAPVCKVVSGCVHEHVIAWDACPDCARQVMTQISDEKFKPKCCKCSAMADRHVCPVMVEVRTPTASSP